MSFYNFIPLIIAAGLLLVHLVIILIQILTKNVIQMSKEYVGTGERHTWEKSHYRSETECTICRFTTYLLGVLFIFLNGPVMETICFIPSIILFFCEVFELIYILKIVKPSFKRRQTIFTIICNIIHSVIGFTAFFIAFPHSVPIIGFFI